VHAAPLEVPPTIAHTMRQETAALREFSPLYVRFGSFASEAIRPLVTHCPLYLQKRT
jgi:hypothetical protein